jgi:hypothetical protein
MRRRKRTMSLADGAKFAGVWAVGDAFTQAFGGVAVTLILCGGVFSLLGLAMIVCGGLFVVLILRREFELDIKALDDPNDNPRANRLIANPCANRLIADRHEHGSFHTGAALLGALLVLIFASAYLHERWIVVTFIAALIIAALIIVITGLVLMRRAMKRI